MNAMGLLLPLVFAAGPDASCGSCPAPAPHPGFAPGLMMRPQMGVCPPAGPASPLLAVKFLLPDGTTIATEPGAKEFTPNCVMGLRPGYKVRMVLAQAKRNRLLYPEIEVRGSLIPRPGMNVSEFPAPIYFSEADLDRAASGMLVTKYVYLEDPKKALPIESKPDEPLEFQEENEREALRTATENGRLVLVVRLGNRQVDAVEWKSLAVPNTILTPGDEKLAAPPIPPQFPVDALPFDPIAGPKSRDAECFTNGGDTGDRLGIGREERLGGLDPTDTSAEFTSGGKRRMTTSNRICICSPRFAIRRTELGLGSVATHSGLAGTSQAEGTLAASARTKTLATGNKTRLAGVVTRVRLELTVAGQGLHETISLMGPSAVATTTGGVKVLSSNVEPDEITSYPDELTLAKSVDPTGPVKSGDVVTFTLRFMNSTPKPVTDLLISDSLSGRLEYVVGSARADRPSNVSTLDNEAGSSTIRFEIPGPIPAGQGGVVKFKARVR